MNKKTIITTMFAAIFGLASCNSDSNYEDKEEQVTVYVSAETGMFYNVPNTTLEEGMMIRIHIVPHVYSLLRNYINGFKKPSAERENAILAHIHKLGKEMMAAFF